MSGLFYQEDDGTFVAVTHGWCGNCGKKQRLTQPTLPHRYATSDYHMGDVCCSVCAWIIGVIGVVAETRHFPLETTIPLEERLRRYDMRAAKISAASKEETR